jgi:hypothetical protein
MGKRDSSRKEVMASKQKMREQRMSKLVSAGAGAGAGSERATPPGIPYTASTASNSSEQSMAAFLSEDGKQMSDEQRAEQAENAAILPRINSGAAIRTDGASDVELLNWLTRTLHISSATAQQYVREILALKQANSSDTPLDMAETKQILGAMSEDEIVEQLHMRRTHAKRVLTLINGKDALEQEQSEVVSGSISFHPSSDWSFAVADPTKVGTGSKAKMAYTITHQRASEGEERQVKQIVNNSSACVVLSLTALRALYPHLHCTYCRTRDTGDSILFGLHVVAEDSLATIPRVRHPSSPGRGCARQGVGSAGNQGSG